MFAVVKSFCSIAHGATVSPAALVNVPFKGDKPVASVGLTPYVYVVGFAAPYSFVCPASTVMVIGFLFIVKKTSVLVELIQPVALIIAFA